MVQETILADFKKYDVEILSVTDGNLLLDDPTRKLVRQVLGAISEYDKSMLVQKLRVARERIKARSGKCEGRKSYKESNPELILEIKKLRRKPRGGKRLSLRKTAEALNRAGYRTTTGKSFSVDIVKNIIYHSNNL